MCRMYGFGAMSTVFTTCYELTSERGSFYLQSHGYHAAGRCAVNCNITNANIQVSLVTTYIYDYRTQIRLDGILMTITEQEVPDLYTQWLQYLISQTQFNLSVKYVAMAALIAAYSTGSKRRLYAWLSQVHHRTSMDVHGGRSLLVAAVLCVHASRPSLRIACGARSPRCGCINLCSVTRWITTAVFKLFWPPTPILLTHSWRTPTLVTVKFTAKY